MFSRDETRNSSGRGSLKKSQQKSTIEECSTGERLKAKDDSFYFESDDLALKGNKDYQSLMKTLVTLEAQRVQAVKDLDQLILEHKKARKDPIGFVGKLQTSQFPDFPQPQTLAEIPGIDWVKYNINFPELMKPNTRHGHVFSQNQSAAVKTLDEKDSKILVRGRAFDESKPETFNQLWTIEEQKRLDELLILYPPEEIEMKRWTKIANALGNRTPKQVSSRVQKYFIKLAKTGLPIPGRGPKFKNDIRKSAREKNRVSLKKSTFFPSESLPFLNEVSHSNDSDREDNSSLASTSHGNTYLELVKEIQTEQEKGEDLYLNLGYQCYICGDEPLKGTRWHCTNCPRGVDLCGPCVMNQIRSEDPMHPSEHQLVGIRPPTYSQHHDSDYQPQSFHKTSYNYLDPNFLPE